MSDISNRTLVGLLVVAIVVSLAGTFVSLSKLGSLGGITGFATNVTTGIGTTSVRIGALAEVTMRVDSVNFGTGFVLGNTTGNFDFCHLRSRINATTASGNTFAASGGLNATPCAEFDGAADSFEIENTGNVQFTNLTINSTNGQSLSVLASSTPGNYSYNAVYDSGATCTSTPSTTGLFVANQVVSICQGFNETSDNDAIALQIEMFIGEDAPAGLSTDTITFLATV